MNDLLKEYRKTMDAGVLHLWAADAVAEIARLRAEADALRDGLEAVYQFGSDTLRGPTGDTPDDRKWHRTAVLEMTNRASRTIDTGSWKKDEGAAMGADA
jgi:hypothetical protein